LRFDLATDIPYSWVGVSWDDKKAASSWHRHGVAFDHAIKAINDPFRVEWIDDREAYGEERIKRLACAMASFCT